MSSSDKEQDLFIQSTRRDIHNFADFPSDKSSEPEIDLLLTSERDLTTRREELKPDQLIQRFKHSKEQLKKAVHFAEDQSSSDDNEQEFNPQDSDLMKRVQILEQQKKQLEERNLMLQVQIHKQKNQFKSNKLGPHLLRKEIKHVYSEGLKNSYRFLLKTKNSIYNLI